MSKSTLELTKRRQEMRLKVDGMLDSFITRTPKTYIRQDSAAIGNRFRENIINDMCSKHDGAYEIFGGMVI